MCVSTAKGQEMIRPAAYNGNIRTHFSSYNLKQRRSKWKIKFHSYLTHKPLSGASIRVPANSVPLSWNRRYITCLYPERKVFILSKLLQTRNTFMDLRPHHCTHKKPTTYPNRSQPHPIQIFTTCFSRFILILSSDLSYAEMSHVASFFLRGVFNDASSIDYYTTLDHRIHKW
jgi:hypothetical protein